MVRLPLESLTLLEAGVDVFETQPIEMLISPRLYHLDTSNLMTFTGNMYGSFWENIKLQGGETKELLTF